MKIVLSLVGGLALSGLLSDRSGDAAGAFQQTLDGADAATLDDARRLFFNAKYDDAAARTLETCAAGPDALAACELRSAALHFQIRRALGDAADRDKAWKRCVPCPDLMTAFQRAVTRGQTLAREHLRIDPKDEATLFLLSKVSLNHVWLHLGTLGRKTGWSEYWEARKTLDKLLKQNPGHVRARVARGWIDYIVDTKMPRGTRWLLGGGSKKRGLLAVREAADARAEFFVNAEARFALWDMQVREQDLKEAVVTARALARDFPENPELTRFLETHEQTASKHP